MLGKQTVGAIMIRLGGRVWRGVVQGQLSLLHSVINKASISLCTETVDKVDLFPS